MQVQLELYASLMQYLPPHADRHRSRVEVSDDTTAQTLLERFAVPPEQAHLVLLNGIYLHPAERAKAQLKAGDVVAAWPPVAGG